MVLSILLGLIVIDLCWSMYSIYTLWKAVFRIMDCLDKVADMEGRCKVCEGYENLCNHASGKGNRK